MANPIKALCNNCGKITDIEYLVTHHPESIQETYIECEHCQVHTVCFVTDSTVRKMHEDKDKLTDSDKRIKLQDEINGRMTALKQELIKSRGHHGK